MRKRHFLEKIDNKGLGLIELMVVLVILSLIILGLVTFFTGGARSWILGQSQLSAQRNARQAMDWMVREIREASNIIATTTSSKKINFTNSWSPDLEYSWSGNKWDPILEGTNPLISNVQSLTFTYFGSSGNSVAPESASKVHIELEVDIDKDENPDITLNTDVKLRNYSL